MFRDVAPSSVSFNAEPFAAEVHNVLTRSVILMVSKSFMYNLLFSRLRADLVAIFFRVAGRPACE
jgi:hypothetical protein